MSELSLSDKRAAAANARWARENPGHPLFLYDAGEKAEPVAWINVRRFTANGPVDCTRVWPAAELTNEEQIFTMYGGGSYELLGRSALPEGTPGRIIKKRRLTLEGASKPFSGEEQVSHVATTASSAPSTGGGFEMFMTMMAEDRREARTRDERIAAERRAEDERRDARAQQAAAQTTQLLVQGLGLVGSVVTAILTRPTAPSPTAELLPLLARLMPEPDRSDPLDKLNKILDVAKKMQPEEKQEGVSDFLAGIGQVLQPVAALEDLRQRAAKDGIPSPLQPPGAPSAPPPPPESMQMPPGAPLPDMLNGHGQDEAAHLQS